MNILYIDIDSLRADHLGCYGYHRATSPNIDALAAEGLRFTDLYVSDAPCLPSRTALWSGRHGLRTGVVNHGGLACEPFREGADRAWAGTFFEDGWMKSLRDLGYHTATFSSFGERHGCWHWYAGFNEIHNSGGCGMERADEVMPQAIDWIERRAPSEKWFLHVNVWDPHTPYRTPEDFGDPFADTPLPEWMTPERFQSCYEGYGPHSPQEPTGFDSNDSPWPRAPDPIDSMEKAAAWFNGYDTGILYADLYIGKLIEALKANGLYNKTIIVIGSDHGENLGERNIWADHQTADRSTCNVPLIIRWPGDEAVQGVNRGLHYHFDWAATLVERLGGKVPGVWDGRSFSMALDAGADGGRDALVVSQGAWTCQRGVRFRSEDGEWLMLRTYHDGYKDFRPIELYDLATDPHETTDLSAARPEIVAKGAAILENWLAETMARSERDVDPLFTVIREGGPYHTRGELPAYLDRLRTTGRGAAAEALEQRHCRKVERSVTVR
ncbi:sulfatase family protein [Consotaella salsifontis]|uniref:Arylsulfatase A n=1 Tax=Consotaella salsifontis TaxID=1365950 RepID=A0A1T4TFF2_9HYPH|nr:sulfatase [Consotaella salsifontis]SKA39213.1 Arylsulfatase A [Consotaella salsifontis]